MLLLLLIILVYIPYIWDEQSFLGGHFLPVVIIKFLLHLIFNRVSRIEKQSAHICLV